MFDPVNETKWDPAWHPRLLGDSVEEGLVFVVGDGKDKRTWVVDRYEPHTGRIGYVVFGPSTVTRIQIDVRAEGRGSTTNVVYTRTALDDTAQASLAHFTEHYAAQGPHWQQAIEAALQREHG